ncbi:MAG: peptidylprolyl isomerase [Paludibacter sp.]|nr:peptidylprolyl isomerase [Paludibacter sp.]
MSKNYMLILLSVLCTSCSLFRNDEEPVIRFETTQGNIEVKLYSETSKHRDNFVKLVESGYYDGLLFHRVIQDFMIQAGDPDSKTAKPGQSLGSGDAPYTIPAEIVYPKYYHKRGALGAAREGDDINPQRASSGGQFYIVKGHKFTEEQLDTLEVRRERKAVARLFQDELTKRKNLKENDQPDVLKDSILKAVKIFVKNHPTYYKFTSQQREDYTTIGGTPHLDGEYTVFGEVLDGFDVINRISAAKTDKMDRPLRDIRIIKATRIQ